MREHPQESLGGETNQVLLLQGHGGVHADVASLAWVADPCRQNAYHHVGTSTLAFNDSSSG